MPSTNDRSSNPETVLYMFQPINPSERYPSYLPTIQVSDEVADFLLPPEVGAAFIKYFDNLTDPVIYSLAKLVDYAKYRCTLQRNPKFPSIGVYLRGYITCQPDDGLEIRTTLDYRTISVAVITAMQDDARAGKLDSVLCRWVLTHRMALENCGGFTLLLVSIREVPQHTGESDCQPHQTRLTERGVSNHRRSFKHFLSHSNSR